MSSPAAPTEKAKNLAAHISKNQFSKLFTNNTEYNATQTKNLIFGWLEKQEWDSILSGAADNEKSFFFETLKAKFTEWSASRTIKLDFSEIIKPGTGREAEASMEVALFKTAELISPLAASLASMEISEDLIDLIKKNVSSFSAFGKKNSHLLRSKLMKLLQEENVSGEGRFLLFFLFSQVKNKTRVLEAIKELPDNVKNNKAFIEVNGFISKKMVQYVTDETPNTFAAVHLPTTNPGLDILCFVLMSSEKAREPAMLYERVTFAQLFLDREMQIESREGNKRFWEKTVLSTKNARNVGFKAEFHEDFYNNAAADKYPLVNFDKTIFRPTNEEIGYTYSDLEVFLAQVPSLVD